MYHYIFAKPSGQILQVVCSANFKLTQYTDYFSRLGYPDIDVLSHDSNVNATHVIDGELITLTEETL